MKYKYTRKEISSIVKNGYISPIGLEDIILAKPTKSSVEKEKKCEHMWTLRKDGITQCVKCASYLVKKGIRPTLKPIEGLDWKYLMDNEDILENLILVQKWFKGVTDRINLLTIRGIK